MVKEKFNKVEIEKASKIDALTVTGGILNIPLVVVSKGGKLMGFVPGLEIESVWGEIGEEDAIISNLKSKAKAKVVKMAKAGEPFSFFPDEATVNFEFSPIKLEVLVARIGKGYKK